MRTSSLKRVGAFDPRLPHAADMELWLRLAANGEVGFIRGVDQAFYRLHTTNMRKGFNQLFDLRERLAVYQTVLDRYGEQLGDAPGAVGCRATQVGPGGPLDRRTGVAPARCGPGSTSTRSSPLPWTAPRRSAGIRSTRP